MSTPWPENPKFCKDCKWRDNDYGMCVNKKCHVVDLVYGTESTMECQWQRSHEGICGIEARYFEPKEQKL